MPLIWRMSYHAKNSSHVTDHLLSFLLSLRNVLHCMLLEIVLNAGSVVLEGAGGVRLPVAIGRRRAARRGTRRAASRPHVCPFYGASVYSCSLFVRRSTCGSYRIVSYRIAIFCLISYRIYRFLLWLYRAITIRFVAVIVISILVSLFWNTL